MIVDSSAIMAILQNEPDAQPFRWALSSGDARMSTATFVELSVVCDRRSALAGPGLDRLMADAPIALAPFTTEQARIARAAHRRFGRGSGHPARLNFGDCFSYALAIDVDEPLLFKGDDFTHTDVRNALEVS